VPRVISLIVLLAIILLVGTVFFQVMAQFIVPLFLACVLLVVFYPLHVRVLQRLPRFPRLSALITTTLILLGICLPLAWLGWNAYLEGEHAIHLLRSPRGTVLLERGITKLEQLIEKIPGRDFGRPATGEKEEKPEAPAGEPEQSPSTTGETPSPPTEPQRADDDKPVRRPTPNTDKLLEKIIASIGPLFLSGVQTIARILFGLIIMVIALYFFLADGPAMIHTLMQISPLAEEQELELLARFGQISRSVVIATMLSAVAQGIAAGIGYYFVLPPDWPLFLLTALTMVLAIVPFVGAAGVWVPVCIGLLLLGGDGGSPGSNWPTVVGFAIYCTVVVSGLDNLIKPYVLHGQSNLHPLLALLSILGGVQVLGPVGILVGPMIVSFLQALLSIFRREMENLGQLPSRSPSKKLSPAAEAIAETIEAAISNEEEDAEEPQPPKKQSTNGSKRSQGRSRRRRK
jgi:predicted PurR-regulated permease PerM